MVKLHYIDDVFGSDALQLNISILDFFRIYDSIFFHLKVVEMEIMLQDLNYVIPSREAICALAAKFR